MAEKGLQQLNRRELLKLLLIQCEEMERMQKEYSEMKSDLKTFMESYERLKGKLNVKDERLNQKDAKIAELTGLVEELRAEMDRSPKGEMLNEAAQQLNKIFEDAAKQAEHYLKSLQAVKSTGESPHIPFEAALKSKVQKRQLVVPLGRKVAPVSKNPVGDGTQGGVMHG